MVRQVPRVEADEVATGQIERGGHGRLMRECRCHGTNGQEERSLSTHRSVVIIGPMWGYSTPGPEAAGWRDLDRERLLL